jgi:OFA family oxalate/formate antiporter-like MFS transporter
LRINNRWFQLTASLLAMIMIANLQYSWTLFVEPLRQGHGWRLSDVQWAFSLFILLQTWVQPVDGWLIDRLGPRVFISVAGVLCGAGWAGMGIAATLPALYVLYCLAGVGAALVYSGAIGSALKWFSRQRGLAVGITAAGFGGGTALFIPAIAFLLRQYGFRAAFIWTGVFQGLVILIVAQFLRHPHADAEDADARFTGPPRKPASRPENDCSTADMLRTPRFYVLYCMFLLMATGGLMVTAQTGPMASAWHVSAVALWPGVIVSAVALSTFLNPLANGGSRILWGWASDRLGRELTMGVAFLLQACCLLLVLTLGRLSGGWFALTLVLTFFTWGEVFSLFPAVVGDYFGSRSATSNYGVMYTAKGISAIIGGGIAARLYEQFGSWSAPLYGSAALALIAAVLAFGLRGAAPQHKPVTLASAAVD